MSKPNIPLNIPKRYSKNLVTMFGVIVSPFYKCDEVLNAGAPMTIDVDAETIKSVTPGSAPEGTVVGLLAQDMYDPDSLGALSGYEFLNNTTAKKGDVVGLVIGQGYIQTKNYVGIVSKNDKLYPAPSGTVSATQTGTDAPIGVAEESGEDGDVLIRVRVNFNLA